jgi:hypothetical protein
MRAIAAILVFTTAVIQLLLGTAYLMSSRHSDQVGRTRTTPGPVTTDGTRAPELRAESGSRAAGSREATTHLVLGILLLALVPVEAVGGILILRRRRGSAALLLGTGAAGIVVSMAIAGVTVVAVVSVCLIAAAAGLTAVGGRPRRPVT